MNNSIVPLKIENSQTTGSIAIILKTSEKLNLIKTHFGKGFGDNNFNDFRKVCRRIYCRYTASEPVYADKFDTNFISSEKAFA